MYSLSCLFYLKLGEIDSRHGKMDSMGFGDFPEHGYGLGNYQQQSIFQ
jgi:hypothetical protein